MARPTTSLLRRGARGTVAAVAALCLLALTSCGDDSPEASEPGSSPTPTQITTSTPTPTEVATPTPSGSAETLSPATLADRLVATSDVPGLNDAWEWQDGETGPADADAFGDCAKVDLVSIGATEVVERTYFPPVDSDDGAAEQVAEFPDARTAATAGAVLKGWHDRCANALTTRLGTRVRVGPITAVPGGGSWYLVTIPDRTGDEGRFHAVGYVVSDTRIAVATIDVIGQDYNYPVGKEPMVGFVRAAAALLR